LRRTCPGRSIFPWVGGEGKTQVTLVRIHFQLLQRIMVTRARSRSCKTRARTHVFDVHEKITGRGGGRG
jgi:hypothetical protein